MSATMSIDATVTSNADGTKTVAVDRSMGGFSAQGGSNLSVPPGFPDDIPIYPQINIVAASQIPSQGFMVQGQTADAMEKVAEFHLAQMNSSGWAQAPAQETPMLLTTHWRPGLPAGT